MKIFDSIFKLAKKTAKALYNEEPLTDLEASTLFSDKAQKRIFQQLSKETVENELAKLKKIDAEKDWEKILPQLKPHKKLYTAPFYKVAAAVILLVSLAYATFLKTKNTTLPNSTGTEIVAGTNKAILTLDDGSHVVLQKGVPFNNELVTSNGERLEYLKAQDYSRTVFNYLTIPRGGEYQLVLSDGTEVWLNADTKLKYPAVFKKGAPRHVELLYGEAFFKVSPSTKHDGSVFKVLTGKQAVEVLGTEFNVKAYSDEQNIYTTLVEGKVNVYANGTSEYLIPGEQSVLDINTKQLTKSKVDVYDNIAWVKGYFNFKDKPLVDIMTVLSRWYDVNIVFESPELKKVRFSGLLSRKQNMDDILNGIKNTKYINAYDIKNKTIIIK